MKRFVALETFRELAFAIALSPDGRAITRFTSFRDVVFGEREIYKPLAAEFTV